LQASSFIFTGYPYQLLSPNTLTKPA